MQLIFVVLAAALYVLFGITLTVIALLGMIFRGITLLLTPRPLTRTAKARRR